MRFKRKLVPIFLITALCFSPVPSQAFFSFGADLAILGQILAQAVQQLTQLKSILGNGKDTLGLIRQINEGINSAMSIMRTMNNTIQPGIFSDYRNINDLLNELQSLYGTVPDTFNAKLETSQDRSVSEAITLHNQAFQYAAQLDPEAEKIKDYARVASPGGANKLTAQSLGVLIHVSNQILRTNAAMLKIMSENLALQNRNEKMSSKAFKATYDGIADGIKKLKPMKDSTLNLK